MKRIFGTDGVRGKANRFPMDAPTLLRLGQAAGEVCRRGKTRHRALIGKDTRLSGYMVESALTSGLASMGMEVLLCGPVPTPAVAYLTKNLKADLGIMISASHNNFQDNGVKLFAPDGYKIPAAMERQIESLMPKTAENAAPPEKIGRAKRLQDAQARYQNFAAQAFPKTMTLKNMRIVIDCANGAAYKIAPETLSALGADVIAIGDKPDGVNINKECGSTSPEAMRQAVRKHKAHIGIAVDGDADRLILADEKGKILDGDHLLAFLASVWQTKERLSKPGIVATILSSLGLERYLKSLKLSLHRTDVGDRHVAEYMRSHQFNLGGEQSGHLLMSDFSTTGDGLISALQILAALQIADKPASAIAECFQPAPQILRNVRSEKQIPLHQGKTAQIIRKAKEKLGKDARLIVRHSGTEPVIRIMGEGDNVDLIRDALDELAQALQQEAA